MAEKKLETCKRLDYADFQHIIHESFKLLQFVIIALFVFYIFSSYTFADEKKERGYKGTITHKALRAELGKVQGKKDEYVKDYIIQGDDIISIIKDTDLEIKISNSIIKGGLDFTKLPLVTPEKAKLPENLSEEKIYKWRWFERGGWEPTEAEYTQVSNLLNIINSEIEGFESFGGNYSIYARRTIFGASYVFDRVTFNKEVYFILPLFNESLTLVKSTFKERASFTNSIFNKDVRVSASDFNKGFFATSSKFNGVVRLHNSSFGGDVDLNYNEFNGNVYVNSTFSGKSEFSCSTFNRRAFFGSSTFNGEARFSESTFNEEARFDRSTFNGDARFSESTFNGDARFDRSTFNGDARFSESTFNGEARFSESTFSGIARFFRARFMKLAYFHKAQFLNALILKQTNFEEYVDLRNTKIRRLDSDNRQSPAIIKGHFDLRNATISEVHFQDILFEKDVYFSDARFGVPVSEGKDEDGGQDEIPLSTIFRYVTFESQADFKRTAFAGNTAFENITFMNEANFTDADFRMAEKRKDADFSLSYLHFNNLRMNWDVLPAMKNWVRGSQKRIQSFTDRQIEEKLDKKLKKKNKEFGKAEKGLKAAVKEKNKNVEEKEKKLKETSKEIEVLKNDLHELKYKNLEPLSCVLKNLEENFRNNKQLYDANQAFYHKKRAELEEAREGNDKGLTKQSVEWWFWGIICGYGTKIWWVLGWSAFSTLFFAFLYCLKGNLTRQQHPETSKEFQFRQRLLDFPKNYYSGERKVEMGKSARKFVNALRFSSVILLKFGYRDTTISGKIMGIDYKYIVWAEWLLGYYILAALAVTISNTMPLVNRLISGVF